MYAKLSFNADAGNDNEQVLADLGALLEGEVTLGNLTGNIDVGNSSFDNAWFPVTWTLYDSIALNTKIYEIDVHDDAAQKFYVEIFTYQADELHMRIWESWDIGSNTGTNGTYYSVSNSPQKIMDCNAFATTPFTIYITATDRHMMIRSEFGAGLRLYFRGFVQYDRGEAWDTPAAGYRPVIMSNSDIMCSGISYAMPHKRSDNTVYTLGTSQLYMHTRYGNSQFDDLHLLLGSSSSNARGLNAAGDSVHNMYEIGFSYLSSGERFLTGKVDSWYLATYQNGAFGDIITISAVDYMIWEADLNYRIAIRKG